MSNRSYGEYLESPAPPPPLTGCVRIATNQRGQFPDEPLPNTPGSGTWLGATSGASGTHQKYVYELVEALPDPDPDVVQQYIVMSNTSGNFQDGELLTPTTL